MAKPTDKQGLFQRDGGFRGVDDAALDTPPGIPTWLKVLGALLLLTAVVFGVLHLLTGGGPRH